jgi:hypothetical protein
MVSPKNKLAIGLLLLILCLSSAYAHAQEPAKPPRLTFADLQNDDLTEGPFRIEGYVVQLYKCPPCPRGAMCKPCIGDHLVITDDVKETDPKLIKRLWVFTDEPSHFEVGKRYSFQVKIRGKKQPHKPVQEVDLLAFDPSDLMETKPGF